MKRPNKKIVRFPGGGEIISMGSQMVAPLTNAMSQDIGNRTTDQYGQQSTMGAFGQGAMKGSQYGLAGMAISGISNLIGAKQRNKEADKLKSQAEINQRLSNNNYAGMNIQQGLIPNQAIFKCGGKSKRKMKYPDGGTLPKIGDVAGMDTTQTDLLSTARRDLYNFSVSDPALYQKFADPQSAANVSTILNENKNPQSMDVRKQFINNWNTQYGKEHGLANPDAPTWDLMRPGELLPSKQKVYDNLYKSYFPAQQTTSKRPLGGAAFGSYAHGGYAVDNRGFANSELEDKEVYRTPQGNMFKVNGNTHAEGGEQFNLPQGTEILGKNIVPGTNKSYKEFGDKLMKDYNKFTKILSEKHTPLAKKTATMMLDKTQKQYSELMQSQEIEKGSHQMSDGSMMANEDTEYAEGGWIQKAINPAHKGYCTPMTKSTCTPHRKALAKRFKSGDLSKHPDGGKIPYELTSIGLDEELASQYDTMNDISADTTRTGYSQSANKPFDWEGTLETAGTVSPIVYNLAQGLFGKAQKLNPSQFYNPNENQSMNLMRSRQYNANPELESNRVQQSSYLRNLRQGAASQAQYLGGLQSGSIMKQRADAETFARKQNTDNQYRGQEAEMLGNFGAQKAQTNLAIQDINDRNESAKKSYLPTALSQLQQYAQNARMTKNLKGRDAQLMDIYKKMYRGYSFAQ